MKFHIVTLFPKMISAFLSEGLLKVAIEKSAIEVNIVDIRDFTADKHRTADDYPFGGGPGMILKPEPVFLAVESVLGTRPIGSVPTILLSAEGRIFNHKIAQELSQKDELILVCGHYKGVDERVRLHLVTDEISIGDYVISGGELAALVVVDAVTRLLPGPLGDFGSAETDSFYDGLLGCGYYTRPREFRDYKVPEVLVSGDHEAIRRWRRRDSLKKTYLRRPDLLKNAKLSEEDLRVLEEIKAEVNSN